MSIQGQCHLHIIFKTQFSQKPLHNVLPLGRGTKVCINGPGHMTKMAAMPIYVVKFFKNKFFLNRWTNFNETWYVALGALALHSLYKS